MKDISQDDHQCPAVDDLHLLLERQLGPAVQLVALQKGAGALRGELLQLVESIFTFWIFWDLLQCLRL